MADIQRPPWWYLRRSETRDLDLCDNERFSKAFSFDCVPKTRANRGNYLAVDVYKVGEESEFESHYFHSNNCDKGNTCKHRSFQTTEIPTAVMEWVVLHFRKAEHSLWRRLATYFDAFMRTCLRIKREVRPWTNSLAEKLGYDPTFYLSGQARNWKDRFTCTEPALMFQLKDLSTPFRLEMSSKFVICDWCTSLLHRFTKTEVPFCFRVCVDASVVGKGNYYDYYKNSLNSEVEGNQNDIVMELNVEIAESDYNYRETWEKYIL